jgi:predicted transcriptional regulator of viral defense system
MRSTPFKSKQTRGEDIKIITRKLNSQDTTMVHGLPVTTVERTLADLVAIGTDLSLVADVLQECMRQGKVDIDTLTYLLKPFAGRIGLKKDDGEALCRYLVGEEDVHVR